MNTLRSLPPSVRDLVTPSHTIGVRSLVVCANVIFDGFASLGSPMRTATFGWSVSLTWLESVAIPEAVAKQGYL